MLSRMLFLLFCGWSNARLDVPCSRLISFWIFRFGLKTSVYILSDRTFCEIMIGDKKRQETILFSLF